MRTNVLQPRRQGRPLRPEPGGPGLRHGLRHRHGPRRPSGTPQGLRHLLVGRRFGTWFWIDPTNDLVFVGMIQNLNGSVPGAGTPAVREISPKAVYAALTDKKGLTMRHLAWPGPRRRSPAPLGRRLPRPRNGFGQPDLEGVWTNASLTSLERGPQFKTLTITEAQAKTHGTGPRQDDGRADQAHRSQRAGPRPARTWAATMPSGSTAGTPHGPHQGRGRTVADRAGRRQAAL